MSENDVVTENDAVSEKDVVSEKSRSPKLREVWV